MKFEALNHKKHNRTEFDCGIETLNLYLSKFASQDQKRSLTKVYVLSDNQQIVGYYSLCAHSVSRESLPEDIKLGRYDDMPFLLLGRLAVDKYYQGQGFGGALIFHAFKTTMETAQKVGIVGMVVDAKDERASAFYESFGFRILNQTKNRLVLPITAMAKLVKQC